MPKTSKTKRTKTKPTPELKADKTEISEDIEIQVKIGGDVYVAKLIMWKEVPHT